MENRRSRRVRQPEHMNLPFHVRGEFVKPAIPVRDTSACPSKIPDSLPLASSNFRMRSRSRTASRRSSISSFTVTDSATANSPMTMASPLSSIYASDIQERFACHGIDDSKPSSRFPRRESCSTVVTDDEYEVPLVREHPYQEHRAAATPGIEQDSPLTPVKMEDCDEQMKEESEQNWTPCASPKPASIASFSSNGEVTTEDVDGLLNYTLQLVYGVELQETKASLPPLRNLVKEFIGQVGQHVWQSADGQGNNSSSSGISPPFEGDEGSAGGKRKKLSDSEDGDGLTDGEGSGSLPSKKRKAMPKEDELRLSCPYRKRNPDRFNVRDYHSCAMTYFPKFAELRQHIVKQHKRDDPSAFVCDRCSRDFWSRKDLRDHQRQPKELMCDISDHDPEAGIDGPTSTKLLSRKRITGVSTFMQWKEIWNIVFPDDDDLSIRPYQYTPVIEHFELAAKYMDAMHSLDESLGEDDAVAAKFRQCFTDAVAASLSAAQEMYYINRSNKRNESTRFHSTVGLISKPKGTSLVSGPDSGIALSDGSEESYIGSPVVETRAAARRKPAPVSGAGTTRVLSGLAHPMRALAPLPLNGSTRMSEAAAAVEDWTNRLAFDDFAMPDPWTSAADLDPNQDFGGLDPTFLFEPDSTVLDEAFGE